MLRARGAGFVWQFQHESHLPIELPHGWTLDDAAPEIEIDLTQAPPSLKGASVAFRPPRLWRLHEFDDTGHAITLHAPSASSRAFAAARMNSTFERGSAWLRPDLGSFALRAPLDQLWTVHRLGHTGDLLLHAAAVAFDGACDVLIGPSGAGKSTLAALLENAGGLPLSDDRVVLRHQHEQWIAHGTPWYGTQRLHGTASARVRRLVFLRHGSSVALREVRGAGAIARLFGCVFFARWQRSLAQATLCAAERLLGQVRCFELEFPPDERASLALTETSRAA